MVAVLLRDAGTFLCLVPPRTQLFAHYASARCSVETYADSKKSNSSTFNAKPKAEVTVCAPLGSNFSKASRLIY